MGIMDFLGDFGQAMRAGPGFATPPARPPMMGYGGGYGGGTPIGGPQQEGGDPFGGAGVGPANQAQPPAAPKRDSGVKSFLGHLGDALLAGAGGEPIYGPKVKERELGETLASYLGNTDAALADIMRRDPKTGLALLKLKTDMAPKREPFTLGKGDVRFDAAGRELARGVADAGDDDPTFVRELEALGIDPRSELAKQIFYAKNSPAGFMLKPSGGGAAPTQPGGVQEGATATNPKTGERIQFKGGQWVPAGGGAGNGTGGFPG